MRRKVTIVGAGQTGATLAHWLALRGDVDIVLYDIVEGMPQGKALDLQEAMPIIGSDARIVGTNGWEETANSDIVVITSGLPRKPGMSRDDLLKVNAEIVGSCTKEVTTRSPNSILILLTNPLDAMCHVALHVSGFEPRRVFGQAGILDTARFRTFLALEANASVTDVNAYVLGGHGDDMVPLLGSTNIGGVPVEKLIPAERLAAIVERTRKGGGEIVSLLKTGSAYYAPSAALAQMIDAVLNDRKRILPCSVYTGKNGGGYGIDDLYLGLPAVIGASGVEKIVSVELTPAEREALHRSAESVRNLVEALKGFDPPLLPRN
ncbi:malate dehydrogenase (NAD) [Chthonomonas calidirosea]|uniref:Malate dehydrogenase n=1 Tax=Chthonomonas calidirosea (strain DSM 23976 / ICMP 18418 / T49) TaxID=1303518 RepID=S0EUS2_CHTCT|nr:malate dehydrogenase [Chthonomonas calidirosea]CCW34097.1 malate dehydrogenase (NAD) [Chthonomonas calidirosea T49]CEK14621.1 malate dehydrogenase (NAD) [Chthonomonas calidirosea]CEK15765.1 malate dehydrogenase (NAD) [Chthonomonas calidirosea]